MWVVVARLAIIAIFLASHAARKLLALKAALTVMRKCVSTAFHSVNSDERRHLPT